MVTKIMVYCGTYAKYNAGSLFGKWLKLSDYSDLKEFYKACKDLHKDERDPEFMYQDRENGFNLIGESWIHENIYEIVETIEDFNDDPEFIETVLEVMEDWQEEDPESVLDSYYGQYDSDEDFAYQLAEDCGYIKDDVSWPYTCIDWEHAARELMYDFIEMNGYYFSNC